MVSVCECVRTRDVLHLMSFRHGVQRPIMHSMNEKIIKNLTGSYFFIRAFEKGMTVKMYLTVLSKLFV